MKRFVVILMLSVLVLTSSKGVASSTTVRETSVASRPVATVVTKKVSPKRDYWTTEDKKEIECLARNIYFESRGESEKGQRAVAIVTVNRVLEDGYPDKICDVVHQRKSRTQLFKCQFSWYCDGLPDVIEDKRAYEKAKVVAEVVYRDYFKKRKMSAGVLADATHYHSTKVQPYWAKDYVLVARIENHLFYKPGKA